MDVEISTKFLKDSVNFTKGDDIGYHSGRCHLMDFYLANFVYGDYLIDSKQVGSLYDYRHGRIDAGMGHDYFTNMTADSNTAVILSLPWDANRDELLDVYLSARNDADDNNKFQYDNIRKTCALAYCRKNPRLRQRID